MEGAEQQPAENTRLQKLPLWIIEYVWAHKMMDIPEVVEPSDWPDVDSQPLSLEDSWRLRVSSARTYSIMKSRDVERFERVMGFLEDTYRLLPKLVPPIKHMKIMFGLKTMVIMWMLRQGQGLVDTVCKINQFFPSKLPQYQQQCSQHDMFLMRKNHVDFKALAQDLAMDKEKLDDYIKYQMEAQYGGHYAQKVEDRLLHYLHKLETVLPGDTYIDKIMKKESPVTEEEKLMLEVVTSDPATIATTLKNLLHCDVASCRQSSDRGKNVLKGGSGLSKSVLYGSSSRALLKSVKDKTTPELVIEGDEADQDLSENSFQNDGHSDIQRPRQTEKDREVVQTEEEESGDKEKKEISQVGSGHVQEPASSPPQFCSKHQRWVESILQECPEECSEELLLQACVSTSPLLFRSSSSSSTSSSSQDRTPSDLVPSPPDQQHLTPQSSHLQTAAQASEQATPKDKPSSGSPGSARDTSETEHVRLPSSSRDTLLPPQWLPVVRLIDIASVRGIYPTLKPHQAPPNHLTLSSNEHQASALSPPVLTSLHCHTSTRDAAPQGTTKYPAVHQQESVAPTKPSNTAHQSQTASVSGDASTSTGCQPPISQKPFSRLSRKFGQPRINITHSQAVDRLNQDPSAEQPTTFQTSSPTLPKVDVSGPHTQNASNSTSHSESLSSDCAADRMSSSPQQVPQNSIKPCSLKHNSSPSQSWTPPWSTGVSSTSNSECLAVRSESSEVQTSRLRLSLSTLSVLLRSKLLQPYVSLTRVSTQECFPSTKGRSSTRRTEPVVQGSMYNDSEEKRQVEEDADTSFDPNILFSGDSSSGDSEDSLDRDPDYKPGNQAKRKRLL